MAQARLCSLVVQTYEQRYLLINNKSVYLSVGCLVFSVNESTKRWLVDNKDMKNHPYDAEQSFKKTD